MFPSGYIPDLPQSYLVGHADDGDGGGGTTSGGIVVDLGALPIKWSATRFMERIGWFPTRQRVATFQLWSLKPHRVQLGDPVPDVPPVPEDQVTIGATEPWRPM